MLATVTVKVNNNRNNVCLNLFMLFIVFLGLAGKQTKKPTKKTSDLQHEGDEEAETFVHRRKIQPRKLTYGN